MAGFSNRLLLLLVLVVLIPSLFFNLAFISRFEQGPQTINSDPLLKQAPRVVKSPPRPRNHTMLVRQYECPHIEKIGNSEGGWTTCITPTINRESVIYSFGLGNDPAFDLTFIRKYGPVVHAFDPTPTGENLFARWKDKPPQWIFHSWGLHKADENMTFLAPKGHDQYSVKNWDGKYKDDKKIIRPGYRLTTIMKKLGHKHIDVCKVDIEGSEWGIIDDLLENKPDVDQLFFEFHFFDLDKTDHYSVQVTQFIEKLNSIGYKWFFRNSFRQLGKRYNPPGEFNYVEYSFIRPSKY
eukprot:TRINITY_DN2142_c0_g1_i1.p1 TRINITY_DN2142_c0_g1~~TRINITY_DN2142_c0_g1_i1.p1  ORF type:complete len:295 (+),score=63.90 TRINITY_DN2142_c0_g1_i1:51-935(+)